MRAMALLPEPTELVIAGDGAERQRLAQLASELGVRVRFVGVLAAAELFALMRQCDVAGFPGLRGDGVPSFVVEALGTGVPVAATDVGGIRRALKGSGGLVVPPGSPDALAEAVCRLLGGDLPQLRRLARSAYEERFTPARVVDQYLECYEEAIYRSQVRARRAGSRGVR